MYLLAITFAGGGLRELQEGGVLAQTQIESIPIPTIDILGIYPTVETFGAQVVLLVVGIAAIIYRRHQQKLEIAEA